MDGVELCARFSYQPNRLKYCGPKDANKIFLGYIKNGKDKAKAMAAIKKFEAAYPYLQLIARKNKKSPFDYDVVEAYWLGNELLAKVKYGDLKKHILALQKRGLPKSFAEGLAKKLPRGMLPHHLFHVMYVGVGMLTGKVKTTLPNMDQCRIFPATVLSVGKKLKISYRPLILCKNKISIGAQKTASIGWSRDFIPEIKVGDIVAVHWSFAVMKLDDGQIISLHFQLISMLLKLAENNS